MIEYGLKVKQKLARGEIVFGSFLHLPSPEIVEIYGLAGYDLVILDTEHGPMGFESLQNMARAADVHGMGTVVRIPAGAHQRILSVLEIETSGVVVPHVNDAEAGRNVVREAKYYPLGRRGLATTARAGNYGTVEIADYCKRANDGTLVIVQIENLQAAEKSQEIAAVEGIDMLLVGPRDMSQSAGEPGNVNHPDVQAAMAKVAKSALACGKVASTFAGSMEFAQRALDMGFQTIFYGCDTMIMSNAVRATIGDLRGLRRG
jgi:4-hydroxy-2-oxoheptanedioate aldolase